MVAIVTFVTTGSFKEEQWLKLNSAYLATNNLFKPRIPARYLLATHDLGRMIATIEKDANAPFVYDRFDQAVEDLQQLWGTIYEKHTWGDHVDSGECFAIIDDQSIKDETIIICGQEILFNDMDDIVGGRWRSWRVRFDHAMEWVSHLNNQEAEINDLAVSIPDDARDRMTSPEGVFDVVEANKYIGL